MYDRLFQRQQRGQILWVYPVSSTVHHSKQWLNLAIWLQHWYIKYNLIFFVVASLNSLVISFNLASFWVSFFVFCFNLANCSAGYYRDTVSNTCLQCAKGSYQPTQWQTSCIQCPTDKTTETTGASSLNMCQCEFFARIFSNFWIKARSYFAILVIASSVYSLEFMEVGIFGCYTQYNKCYQT